MAICEKPSSDVVTKELAVTLLFRAIPHPKQITVEEVGESEIRFSWRGSRYSFSWGSGVSVWELGDGTQTGSNKAILIAALLGRALVESWADGPPNVTYAAEAISR